MELSNFEEDVNTNDFNQAPPENLTLYRSIRLYPKITALSLGIALSFLLVGYDTAVLSTITAVPRFKEDYGQVYNGLSIIPASWLSIWSAFGPIGSMAGATAAGWYQDHAGRRWSLGMSCGICCAGVVIVFCSHLSTAMNPRRGIFLVGRTIQGFGTGGAMAVGQTYLSETVPISLRGSVMALSPTFMLLGELLGAIVIYVTEKKTSEAAYLIPFAVEWVFAGLPLLLACFIVPESPSYLIRRGRPEEARQSLTRLHTVKVDVSPLLAGLEQTIVHEEQISSEISYLDCFKGVHLRRTLIVCFSFGIPSLFGVPLLSNASYFMQIVGMSSSLSIIILILGIVLGLFANAVGVWLTSRIGRRRLILVSLAITTFIWLGMGIAGFWSGHIVIWYTAASMIAVVVVCGLGAWPASFSVSGDASSLRLRAKTQGIGVLCYMLSNVVFSLILPYIYDADAGDLKGKTGFVYFGLCFITFTVTWFLIPEMKGRSVLEIDHMFELNLRTRQFKNWSSDGIVDQVKKEIED